MPLLMLQPMLDFYRDQQLQLNPELERAYAGAKAKVLKVAEEGAISVLKHSEESFQEDELN